MREADQNYRTSQELSEAWGWKFQTLKAQALLFQGKSGEALERLKPDIPLTVPADVRAGKRIIQADGFCRLGQPQQAGPLLTDAESLIATGDHQVLRAEMALTRGRCALLTNHDAAKQFYILASQLARGKDEFIEATAFLNLGFVLLPHYDEAADQFLRGLKVTTSPLLKEKLLGNLGFVYSQLGEMQRALPFSQQAESLAADIRNGRDQAKWLIDLGREHFHQLKYSEAGAAYSHALEITKNLHELDGQEICLNNLAQLGFRTNDVVKAEEYTRQLEALNPGGEHHLDLLLNQAELAEAKSDFPAAEQLLKQLLEQMPKQGVEPALAWKAQSDLAGVYVAQGKFDLAEKQFRAAIASAENSRSKIERVEYRISFLDFAPFYDKYVKFLMSRNRSLDALDVAELGRSPTLSEGLLPGERKPLHGARLQSIQRKLKEQNSIVLAYWLGWEESYLWVITPSEIKPFHLPAEPDIEKEVETYNREIIDTEPSGKSHTAEKLYEILLRPAAALIPKGSSVVIVPHRKLYNLNFETIVVPGAPPHYWIEDVHVQNLSFLSALLSRQPRSADGGQDLLLIGAPVEVDKQFPVLKHAATEMQKVASHFPATRETVIAGKEATPQAYLGSHPDQFSMVHFVTHGTSSTVLENPLDSSIILSPGQGGPAISSDPEGSYHLYGREIMKTPLRAQLVTISACYGLGREFSGEGLVGLAWAFMRAGAHQVIAALWEVDDASSPQLMDDFYGELSQGKSAAEALRDAKLKMLHSADFHRHPYYWASLQLYSGS